MRPTPQRACVAALVIAAGLFARDARADFEFQFATTVSGGWLRQTPALTSRTVSTSARDIGGNSLKMRGGMAMFGVGGDMDITLDDRWRIPLVGGTAWWAVGSYDATVTSVDGSIARVRPWSTFRGDLLLPGIGRRWKHRRNMWAAAVRTGLTFATMGGSVAAGAETAQLDLRATTILVQLELEACRRLDPTTRICAQLVPRLYEYELLNGVTFGLRMEWGQ